MHEPLRRLSKLKKRR